MRPSPDVFLERLRESHPDFEYWFTHGGCISLYTMLHHIWPEAVLYFSFKEGHVYTRIGGSFYDIRGARAARQLPKDLQVGLPTPWRNRRPHRWQRWAAQLYRMRQLGKLVEMNDEEFGEALGTLRDVPGRKVRKQDSRATYRVRGLLKRLLGKLATFKAARRKAA